ncbi:terpenoid cyclases/protein prenyltransferase alpha-alpha toroid [Gautieria morchelliformis]|nr:terpenoid cyclases/protein prenyltransferase alpha-alpha toroid [Gautieria morchelliformis]
MTPTPTAVHIGHFMRCINGLPASKLDLDTSRLGIGFYCLSGLDLLGVLGEHPKVNDMDRQGWRDWIWSMSTQGRHGFGFNPGSSLKNDTSNKSYDPPHLVMTYTALLSLSILRDDFSQLDRSGLISFLKSTQHTDGSFSPLPIGTVSSESDLRLTFCTFAICSMLDDWSAIDVDKAVEFIKRCRTYEGGYGESPGREAHGGTTYCALASLRLLSISSQTMPHPSQPCLTPFEVKHTLRWLLQKQRSGFQGRTEKNPDACYCFWCGASIKLLGGGHLVDNDANANFLSACHYKYGGIAKEPGETADPYHTYLALASLSLYPPTATWLGRSIATSSWSLPPLDPLLNLRKESADWARRHIPSQDRVAG